MTFSIQHNPFLPVYPNMPYSPADSSLAQKALAFKQTMSSRLPGSYGIDLINNLLSTYASAKLTRPDDTSQKLRYPPLSPIFSSPVWFQQALGSPFQPGSSPHIRQLPEDLSMPMTSRLEKAADANATISRHPPPSVCKRKSASHRDGHQQSDPTKIDSLLYCQPTFYPILRDQVERVHQSCRTSENLKLSSSLQVHETGTLVPSLIDGEVIMGFNVWGEKRLCLPHLFRFVLNDVDLKAIDEACTKLQITCTTCSPAQLSLLHSRKILPHAVSSCGLIRKSDAERLTKFIRNQIDTSDKVVFSHFARFHVSSHVRPSRITEVEDEQDGVPSIALVTANRTLSGRSMSDSEECRGQKRAKMSGSSDELETCTSHTVYQADGISSKNEPIPVIHECFGRQLGLIRPDLYKEASSKCIECQTCHRLFAPDQFVGHTHTVTEVDNLNHWGFDSSNWRCYLRLYTGRRWDWSKRSTSPLRQPGLSEGKYGDLSQSHVSTGIEAHRRLEEFKIKFAQPIRLPASLSAALRTVGLCASVAPIPTPTAPLCDLPSLPETNVCSHKSPFISPKGALSKDVIPDPTNMISSHLPTLPTVMLPQLTLRRLWAPNDGRIKVPPLPIPAVTRIKSVLPSKLHTGPPLLLHSHRVVSQAAADQYDRDFIPNVCLMPPLKSKSGRPYTLYRRSSHSYSKHLSRQCDRMRNFSNDSSSRSNSRSSSGSSSSRTRSVSVTSTSSSCCSCTFEVKRHCNGLVFSNFENDSNCSRQTSFSDSDHSLHVDDDPKPLRRIPHKLDGYMKPRSHSWTAQTRIRSHSQRTRYAHSDSVVSVYDRQLTEARHRRCRSLNVLSHSSTVMSHSLLRSSGFTQSTICRKSFSKAKGSCRHEKSPRHSQNRISHKQDRALAAAKAAQAAANRVCPGLWSRHFANFSGTLKGPLDLPLAREPLGNCVHPAQQPKQNSCNTPVLVTSPTKNSLPSAVLALESVWADLVRHINEYAVAIEARYGVNEARQRLFEQFITMQTCYATHIAALMSENQKLHYQLSSMEGRSSKGFDEPSVPHQPLFETDRGGAAVSNTHDPPHSVPIQAALSSATTVYPHRNRKESSRIFTDVGTRFRTGSTTDPNERCVGSDTSVDIQTQSFKNDLSKSPLSLPVESHLFENSVGYRRSLSQHQFIASPNCLTNSSDDTNQTSTTSTASETDGLTAETKYNDSERRPCRYRRDFSSKKVITDRNKDQVSETECGSSDSFREPERRYTDEKDDQASCDSLDRPIDSNAHLFNYRFLLPYDDDQPRSSFKLHSRLLNRSS